MWALFAVMCLVLAIMAGILAQSAGGWHAVLVIGADALIAGAAIGAVAHPEVIPALWTWLRRR